MTLKRSEIFPELELPQVEELLTAGRRQARATTVGSCPFLIAHEVASESEYKRRSMSQGKVMLHAQIGYRRPEKTRRAWAEIHRRLEAAGYGVDRYGICLDWSMGYPASRRAGMPRGTGLILDGPDDFIALTHEAPVAPHFGDFVLGTPAAFENAAAALAAGSTSIGNLGQYFNFRLPRWDDDVTTTAETVQAIALCAAQPVEVLIHSNLDDGFAALFCDLACAVGAALLERTIVDERIGGRVSHCYGHTFSDPVTRLAFQRALAEVSDTPGSMVYGNTTIYGEGDAENYANLGSYLFVDILAQKSLPSGHGLNPVPVTEAMRIPEIDEIVDAHLFANRLVHRSTGFEELFDVAAAERIKVRLIEGGRRFHANVLAGLAEAGVDTGNPFELLLAIRRVGAKRLEELFGPGQAQADQVRGRLPVVRATTVAALESRGEDLVGALSAADRDAIRRRRLSACVTSTDMHEYGKILLEAVLRRLDLEFVDAGVGADPEAVARRAHDAGADFVAVSTYNGVALDYLEDLRREMTRLDHRVPVFIGGKLNQIPEDSETSLPVDVSGELRARGAIVCHRIEDMLSELRDLAGEPQR